MDTEELRRCFGEVVVLDWNDERLLIFVHAKADRSPAPGARGTVFPDTDVVQIVSGGGLFAPVRAYRLEAVRRAKNSDGREAVGFAHTIDDLIELEAPGISRAGRNHLETSVNVGDGLP